MTERRSPSIQVKSRIAGARPWRLFAGGLRGDLDTVVSVALRKEPERRYASVDQFSEDLGRYLEGHPIRARKDTVGYRMSKFATRHPVGVGVGVATFLLLCVLSLYASWEARRLSRRMAEDHQLASTFLVEVHDAIANLPALHLLVRSCCGNHSSI